MKITFGGSRGSRPLHDKKFARFGGATTSVLVQGEAGELIVIDCGSGVATIEADIMASNEPVLILFTHLHLDHMLGFPSFRPLYARDKNITLAGPDKTMAACKGLFSKPYWPMDLDSLPSLIHNQPLHPVKPGNETNPSTDDSLEWGGLSIRCMKVNHPGGCLAYRIEEHGTGNSLFFATDMEWGLMGEKHKERFLDFASHPQNPTVLAMDGHFSAQEYPEHTGWGHSTQEQVVTVGQSMGCKHILVTHHNPENDDVALDKRRLAVKGIDKRADLISQGMIIDLA